MNEPWKVLQKDGTSYIEIRRGSNQRVLINSDPVVLCPGNDKWAIVEGDVHSIQGVKTVRGEALCFRLAERYRGIVPNLPETQPLDAFEFTDCGGIKGELAEFYEVVRREDTEEFEPREWQVIDMDCEPAQLPDYVKVEFPNDLSKYPCYILYKTVFDFIWDRVSGIVDNSNGKYRRDNFKGIQALRVWQEIPANFDVKRLVIGEGKKATRVKRRVCEATILSIVGDYKRDYMDTVQIENVRGENYEDLQKNLEEYIQSFLVLLDKDEREICPHCEGAGIVTTEVKA